VEFHLRHVNPTVTASIGDSGAIKRPAVTVSRAPPYIDASSKSLGVPSRRRLGCGLLVRTLGGVTDVHAYLGAASPPRVAMSRCVRHTTSPTPASRGARAMRLPVPAGALLGAAGAELGHE